MMFRVLALFACLFVGSAQPDATRTSRASAQPADPLGEAATFFGGGGMFGPSTRVIPGVGLVYKPE